MKIARRVVNGLLVAVLAIGAGLGLYLHHEGYRAYIIHTGSMTGAYNSGGLVIDRPVGSSPLHVGQTITYLHGGPSPELITHRVVGLKHGFIQTKGDANKIRDTWNTDSHEVRGVVVHYLPDMGYVVYYLSHRAGDLSVVTALLGLVLLWDLFFAGMDSGRPEDLPVLLNVDRCRRVTSTVAIESGVARLRRRPDATPGYCDGQSATLRLRHGRHALSPSTV